MASPDHHSPDRRTWITSMEFRQRARTHNSSSTPELQSPVEDFRKVAACRLTKGNFSGQGIWVSLDEELGESFKKLQIPICQPPLVLVTNYNIVPSMSHIKDVRLQLSNDRPMKLKEWQFEKCLTCCGQNGVWGGEDHYHQPPSLEDHSSCPAGGDFTVLFPTQALVSDVIEKYDLWFPMMVDIRHRHLQDTICDNRFYVYYRDENGVVIREEIRLRQIAAENRGTLESEVDTYLENCKLRYDMEDLRHIQKQCLGAGIVCCGQMGGCKELILLGIHTRSVNSGMGHNGITLHSIFHPISGELPVYF